jgi:hypothetical protein
MAYALAAWLAPPGFYDGIAPAQPYNWVSPPPQFAAGNRPAQAGHGSVSVESGGQAGPGSVSTGDNQATVAFGRGAFTVPAGGGPVSIDIEPVTGFPDPGRVRLVTNVYCITSSAHVTGGRDVQVTLLYSNGLPAPGSVYENAGSGPWRKLPSVDAALPYRVAGRAGSLGCFAGGYEPGSTSGGGFPTLPLLVALSALIVVLAAVPLLIARRRG